MSLSKEIVVESDSKNAVTWVNGKDKFPWNLRFFYNKMLNIIPKLRSVRFSHKNREVNEIADARAKGAEMEGCGLGGFNLVFD